MGQNWGQAQGGPIWYDVALDVSAGEIGDALAVFVSDADLAAEWEIVIYANVHEGQYRCGSMVTRSALRGDPLARLVAVANVPGAKGWKASVRAIDGATNYQAQITLSSSAAPSGAGLGVNAVKHGNDSSANRSYQNGNSATGTPVSGPNVVLFEINGTFDQAEIANAADWVMLFDSAAVPVAGATPFLSAHLGQSAFATPDGSNWTYSGGPFGRRIANRLWCLMSSTPGTYTPSTFSSDYHASFALT